MSGVEVIGVVLGALPLLISGLEHYANGADTIRRAIRAGREFRILEQKLQDENLLFRNTITILLEECVDVETQGKLMKDVEGLIWKEPAVRQALEHRLGDSYSSYLLRVQSIRTNIGEFNKRLGITEENEYPFDIDKYSFRLAYDKLRFAMKKEKYSDLLEEIGRQNTFLEKIGRQSKTLQSIRSLKQVPDYQTVRSSASSVFEALKSSLQVSCAAAHRASLCLSPNTKSESDFRLVLDHPGRQLKDNNLPWSVEEVEARLLAKSANSPEPSPAPPPTIQSVKSSKKKVGFREITVASGIVTTSAMVPAVATPDAASVVQEIRDLCHSIQTLRTSSCDICLGYLECLSSSSRHELYYLKQRALGQDAFSVNALSSILDQKAPSYRKISGRDARKLAVPLANGLLRLHSTPWLQETWDQRDVMLICHNGKILAEFPYISREIRATGALASTAKSLQGLAASVIKDQMLFTLGIVLIELCMKQSINNLHISSELNADGSKHDLSDYQTAVRLLETNAISDEFGERWSNIVYRCIHCNLDCAHGKRTLENPSYRKAFYDAIVLRLEEEHRQIFTLE